MTRFGYDTSGFLKTITDPVSGTWGMTRDSVGRVIAQALEDGETVAFSYDAEGRVSSLTPPGRPPHSFTYTAAGSLATYTPPPVGPLSGTVAYVYDDDGQLAEIRRPDGRTVHYDYDDGRPRRVTLARGEIEYQYDATSRQLAAILAPGNVELHYGNDAPLLVREAWTGAIAGSIAFTYDNDFRVSRGQSMAVLRSPFATTTTAYQSAPVPSH